jgi:hypothetical protein
MASWREAAALLDTVANSGDAHVRELAQAIHRLDARLEAIESLLGALVEKAALIYGEKHLA